MAITRMQQKRGTAAEWYAENPILADGEIGFERDTGVLKVGNGVDSWVELVPIIKSVQAPLEAEWIANNPVLAQGEVGIARDTYVIKIGDGQTSWVALPQSNTADFLTAAIARDTYLKKLLTSSQKTSNYTLALSDLSTVIEMNSASAVTCTIPPNSTVPLPVGSTVEIFQLGPGQVTVIAGSGVSLLAPLGAKTALQHSSVFLRQRSLDEWVVSGDTTT